MPNVARIETKGTGTYFAGLDRNLSRSLVLIGELRKRCMEVAMSQTSAFDTEPVTGCRCALYRSIGIKIKIELHREIPGRVCERV
jgi:environmental stress-induced protein Ves